MPVGLRIRRTSRSTADRLTDVLERRPGDREIELAVGGREARQRRRAEVQRRRERVGDAVEARAVDQRVVVGGDDVEADQLGRLGAVDQPEVDDPVARADVRDALAFEADPVTREEVDDLRRGALVVVEEPLPLGGFVVAHRASVSRIAAPT